MSEPEAPCSVCDGSGGDSEANLICTACGGTGHAAQAAVPTPVDEVDCQACEDKGTVAMLQAGLRFPCQYCDKGKLYKVIKGGIGVALREPAAVPEPDAAYDWESVELEGKPSE